MNESRQACCEHYQSRDEWIHYHARHNFSFPASQLVCYPAHQPASLITCPHTEHLLSRLKEDRWGREKYYFFSQKIFLKRRCVEFFYSVCLTASLPDPFSNCPVWLYYSLWQAAFLSTCLLKYLPSSLSLCTPLCRQPLSICVQWMFPSLSVW